MSLQRSKYRLIKQSLTVAIFFASLYLCSAKFTGTSTEMVSRSIGQTQTENTISHCYDKDITYLLLSSCPFGLHTSCDRFYNNDKYDIKHSIINVCEDDGFTNFSDLMFKQNYKRLNHANYSKLGNWMSWQLKIMMVRQL